jgi:hypothetical protein
MIEPQNKTALWQKILLRTGIGWFIVAAFGQLAFITFIVMFYGVRTFAGNFAGWNDKSLIIGHVPGDTVGNLLFGMHVLLAAVMTLGGLLQLVPLIRRKYPAFHRWNGRIFIVIACYLALGGLWMTWMRGAHLSVVTGVSVSLNGVLILVFSVFTVRHAMARRIAIHQRWAMRTFMVANGVWFFRIGLMGWIMINQSPRGMNETLSGPADIALSYGSYLIPLAALEIYMAAKRSQSVVVKVAVSCLIVALTLFTAIGIIGAMKFMWF